MSELRLRCSLVAVPGTACAVLPQNAICGSTWLTTVKRKIPEYGSIIKHPLRVRINNLQNFDLCNLLPTFSSALKSPWPVAAASPSPWPVMKYIRCDDTPPLYLQRHQSATFVYLSLLAVSKLPSTLETIIVSKLHKQHEHQLKW